MSQSGNDDTPAEPTDNGKNNTHMIDYETEASMTQAYGKDWKSINPSVFEQKGSDIKVNKQTIQAQTQSEEEYENEMCMGLIMGHS